MEGFTLKVTNNDDESSIEIYEYGKLLERFFVYSDEYTNAYWAYEDPKDKEPVGLIDDSFRRIVDYAEIAYRNNDSFISVSRGFTFIEFWDSRPKGIFRRERKPVRIEFRLFDEVGHWTKKYDLFTIIEMIRLANEDPEECAELLETLYRDCQVSK